MSKQVLADFIPGVYRSGVPINISLIGTQLFNTYPAANTTELIRWYPSASSAVKPTDGGTAIDLVSAIFSIQGSLTYSQSNTVNNKYSLAIVKNGLITSITDSTVLAYSALAALPATTVQFNKVGALQEIRQLLNSQAGIPFLRTDFISLYFCSNLDGTTTLFGGSAGTALTPTAGSIFATAECQANAYGLRA